MWNIKPLFGASAQGGGLPQCSSIVDPNLLKTCEGLYSAAFSD